MNHRIAGRKLGRTTSHRSAMFRNMVTSLFIHEKIRTTDSKAKEIRKIAEKMVTLGKRGDLHARRQAGSFLRGHDATKKLFSELAERYQAIQGGYTRIVKVGYRRGDGALISIIEMVDPQESAPKKKPRSKKAKKKD